MPNSKMKLKVKIPEGMTKEELINKFSKENISSAVLKGIDKEGNQIEIKLDDIELED